MAIMPRIRKLLSRSSSASASTVGLRRETPHTHNVNVVQEDALRAVLSDDPNNVNAFKALVDVVTRNCAVETSDNEDPLNASSVDSEQAQIKRMSIWALAEEFSGHPRAWRPLLELARLSIEQEPEEAQRRVNAALARDTTGEALAEAIALYTRFDRAGDAYNFAIGHWKPREHVPQAGVALVRAAVLGEKHIEAETALAELLNHATAQDIAAIDATLLDKVHVAHK